MKRHYWINIFCLILLVNLLNSCDDKLEKILDSKDLQIRQIIDNLDKHNLQIIYSKIIRNGDDKVSFKDYFFNVDDDLYYYPASTVKLHVSALTLQKLTELNDSGISINLDSEIEIISDNNTLHNQITFRELIKIIFIISDNEAYNILFDFLGKDYISRELNKKGFFNTHITHNFSTKEYNENIFYVFYNDGKEIYRTKSGSANLSVDRRKLKEEKTGKGYYFKGKIINSKFDFSNKNFISLKDLHSTTKQIIFRDNYKPNKKFNLSNSYYNFLIECMGLNTLSDSNYYEPKFWDSYVKFFMFGDSKKLIPKDIKIYNKVGLAYGHLTETAYITNENKKIEFLLSATLKVNENEIYNDGVYEYDSIGIPFLSKLGKLIYQTYEN
ncbi:MAG: serine hydrolase [Bacteroidota bacterium]|nr:serine hydrolase [Bacteroidota bacterium]